MATENPLTRLFLSGIPYFVIFLLVTLLFGTFFYISCLILRIEDKSETERYFWLRSYATAFFSALVVVFFEFIFLILMFSPLFGDFVPVDLINAVMTTALGDIVAGIIQSDVAVIVSFAIVIALTVITISLIMLEAYKVNFLWTTAITWLSIGMYFGIDLLLDALVIDRGLSGVFSLISNTLRTLFGL